RSEWQIWALIRFAEPKRMANLGSYPACRAEANGKSGLLSGLPSRSEWQPARLRPSGYDAAAFAHFVREGWWGGEGFELS
ncbi:MAG: hypothetical protein PHE27_06610, partial [Alphaproteobacteria bacterium]|nr:hypothetical protein [Alphaproteobacteria bacterium]